MSKWIWGQRQMPTISQSILQIATITSTVAQQFDNNTEKGKLKASGRKALPISQ